MCITFAEYNLNYKKMNSNLKLDGVTKYLLIIVIIVHLMFFILEAVFWMNPLVYNILLSFLNNPVTLDYPTQAITLRNLFVNQGYYNLFLALGGVLGLHQISKSNFTIGYTLALFLCFCGVGAGIVLLLSTKAYILALLQAVPAAITFFRIYPVLKLYLIQSKIRNEN